MARTLYLNDGSTEVVIGDQEEVLEGLLKNGWGEIVKNSLMILKTNGLRNPGTPTVKRIMRELLMDIIRCYKTLWKIWTQL